jgi:FixJ family two-component response regulator
MAKYNVLIVDDERIVREMLLAGIETLGADFAGMAVPSGEEALLEISLSNVDLLVTDIRLPGISGLDLMDRVVKRAPDLKVILITGVLDPVIRQKVADAGADAFFLKPIEVADFLDAVERSLGIISTPLPGPNLLQSEEPEQNVSYRLTDLRQDLDALSAVLLDERGRVMAQAGDLPDFAVESNLFPSLMAVFSAGVKVSQFLGTKRVSNLAHYAGSKYDLFFVSVGDSAALLVAVNPVTVDEQLNGTIQTVLDAMRDLYKILTSVGVSLEIEEELVELPIEDETVEEPFEEDEEQAPILDAIFEKAAAKKMETGALDAFWEALTDEDTANGVVNADALTYEQALQLGLAPEEEEEESGESS